MELLKFILQVIEENERWFLCDKDIFASRTLIYTMHILHWNEGPALKRQGFLFILTCDLNMHESAFKASLLDNQN